jgi:hypothetical protein
MVHETSIPKQAEHAFKTMMRVAARLPALLDALDSRPAPPPPPSPWPMRIAVAAVGLAILSFFTHIH